MIYHVYKGETPYDKERNCRDQAPVHPANCSISRICGCYVDGEKNKKAEFKEAFLSLPEEDMFKYFELLRKNLSGTLGKNLINLEFPLAAEEKAALTNFC